MSLNNSSDKLENKDRKDASFKFEDIDIKKQLKNSFEINNIQVSEELIQRTLNTINQEKDAISEKQGKKTLPSIVWNRHIRLLAGAVAAVFVFAVSINAISSMGGKEDRTENAGFSIAYDDRKNAEAQISSTEEKEEAVASDKTKEDLYAAQVPELPEDKQESKKFAIASEDNSSSVNNRTSSPKSSSKKASSSDTVKESNVDKEDSYEIDKKVSAASDKGPDTADRVKAANTEGALENTADDIIVNEDYRNITEANEKESAKALVEGSSNEGTGNEDMGAALFDSISYISFRDIIPTNPEQADTITINNLTNNTEIILSSQKQIEDFYSLMDQHKFIIGGQDSAIQTYIIEVKSQTEAETYTIDIGEDVKVHNTKDDEVTQTTYAAENEKALMKDMNEFYLNNSK